MNPDGCRLRMSGNSVLLTGDPMLEPLTDNGGPTQTMALSPGSQAIGAVTRTKDCKLSDQRGVARTAPCDLGAYEVP